MKILLAPASFKGALTAAQAAAAMATGIRRILPDAEIRQFPMADGGEGSLDVILAATGGHRFTFEVQGAGKEKILAGYGVLDTPHGRVAMIESAQVVGFAVAGSTPVGLRTTYGIGELLRHCLDQGLRNFLIGLGGSSTNDGGAGMLKALGVEFLDAAGRSMHPSPDGLAELVRLDFSRLDPRVKECRITLLTDVRNPLCGEYGATVVYGPQKGVEEKQVPVFDACLGRLAQLGNAWFGSNLSASPGAGAAGGLGYALQLLGAHDLSGAQGVAERIGLGAAIQSTDWVITGEGRSDSQTLQGKAPMHVAELARQHGKRVALLSGSIDSASMGPLSRKFDLCLAVNEGAFSLQQAMLDAVSLLENAAMKLAEKLSGRDF